MELGVYIHIPFCKKKCDYCDFISFDNKKDCQKEYVQALLKEIEYNGQVLKENNISTIYIGGGTPSFIDEILIKDILEKIFKEANIRNTDDIEITIEVNPGTASREKLKMYKDIGINRVSIGLQSTNDDMLKKIGRIHNYNQFLNTYNWAIEAGFENINVDLMLGLPEQNIDTLKKSLNEVINLMPAPKHISVYSLILEEGTVLQKRIEEGELKLPSDEEERDQYHYVKNFLELNGYKHYEISNFSISGYESKHNMNCWEQKQYVGFGVSAHSYLNGMRYSNTTDLNEYLLEDYEKIRIVHEVQNVEDMMKEYMMLGLRKLDGVSVSEFKYKFGDNPIYVFRKEFQKLVDDNLIVIDLDNIKLTPKGLDLANLVWEEFVHV